MPWIVFDMDQHLMRVSKGSLCWVLACMSPQGLEGSLGSVAVGCTATELVAGNQCVAAEDKGGELGLTAGEGIEAAVVVEQVRCPVFDSGSIHLLWGEDSRSVGIVHLGKVFGRLRMRSERPLTVGRSSSEISLLILGMARLSLFAIFLAEEQLRKCSRMQHLFDRMTHGHSDLALCSSLAESHNPPCLIFSSSLLANCHQSLRSSQVRRSRCFHSS